MKSLWEQNQQDLIVSVRNSNKRWQLSRYGPKEDVKSPSLEIFKIWPDEACWSLEVSTVFCRDLV